MRASRRSRPSTMPWRSAWGNKGCWAGKVRAAEQQRSSNHQGAASCGSFVMVHEKTRSNGSRFRNSVQRRIENREDFDEKQSANRQDFSKVLRYAENKERQGLYARIFSLRERGWHMKQTIACIETQRRVPARLPLGPGFFRRVVKRGRNFYLLILNTMSILFVYESNCWQVV